MRESKNFFQQMLQAEEWECRMIAHLLELERQGIVRRDCPDGWTVLDAKRWREAGMDCASTSETVAARQPVPVANDTGIERKFRGFNDLRGAKGETRTLTGCPTGT